MKKIIISFPNYEIYSNGDVINITTNKKLSGSIGEHGYKYYRLTSEGKKKMQYAHRLVAEAFLPNPDNLPVVNHKDGNKLNNAVENLEWVTYSENSSQAHDKKQIMSRRKSEYYTKDLEGEYWAKTKNPSYSVSSLGRVRNDKTNLILKPSITCGYYKVRLSHEGLIQDVMVHHLVYETFIEERDSTLVINHKDGNKLNNSVSNLEQIALSDNVLKAYYQTKTNKSCKKVGQFSLDGQFIAEYPSTRQAAQKLGLDASTISKVCRGQNKTHGGFIFKYL